MTVPQAERHLTLCSSLFGAMPGCPHGILGRSRGFDPRDSCMRPLRHLWDTRRVGRRALTPALPTGQCTR
jgi:hypothetical protein